LPLQLIVFVGQKKGVRGLAAVLVPNGIAGHSRGTDPNKTFADAIFAQPDDRRPGSSPPQIDS
jgi:hypothetical protein